MDGECYDNEFNVDVVLQETKNGLKSSWLPLRAADLFIRLLAKEILTKKNSAWLTLEQQNREHKNAQHESFKAAFQSMRVLGGVPPEFQVGS